MKFIGIIPARYASTRFPGKPLAILGGKTVIQRVYEKVTSCLETAYVATDDQRIFDHVKSWGGNVVMTSPNHKSGTDRIEEAIEKIGGDYDVIINIQGDEPFIDRIPFKKDIEVIQNANSPKIVVDNRGFAMYFSRSVIPFIRGKENEEWPEQYPFLKHIGLYAYRREVLKEVTSLPQSSLEIAESLEQLRWLQNGYKIKVGTTNLETIGIDTPEDLANAEKYLQERQ